MRRNGRLAVAAQGALGVLIAAVGGFAALFACIALFSFLMTKIDVSDSVLTLLTSAALCVGAYTGGYIASKRRRKNGLIMGVLCGLFMFLAVFLAAYFFAGSAGGFSGSAKFVMTLVCAGIGGVVGVNSKGRRFRL